MKNGTVNCEVSLLTVKFRLGHLIFEQSHQVILRVLLFMALFTVALAHSYEWFHTRVSYTLSTSLQKVGKKFSHTCSLHKFSTVLMLCEFYLLVTEAADGGLKILLWLMVKCSCLDIPDCWSSTTTYEVCCILGCCCPLHTTWVC